ncbi:MAG: nucleotidyltransferase family protein [Natronosporangium sp.]
MDLDRPLTVVAPTVDADALAVLAGAAAPFSGRQVHQLAGRHSERGIRNALHRLHQQGIVIRERAGSSDLFRLNRDHLAARHIEAIARLRSELFDRITKELDTWTVPPQFAAVFGSAARGGMRPDSDIDLFVVRPDEVDPDSEGWRSQLADLTGKVTAWTGNDCRVLELAGSEVRAGSSASSRVLGDIRTSGIVLHGPASYLRRNDHHG